MLKQLKPETIYKLLSFIIDAIFLLLLISSLNLINIHVSTPLIIGSMLGLIARIFIRSIEPYKKRDKYIVMVAAIILITTLMLVNKDNVGTSIKIMKISPLIILIFLFNIQLQKRAYEKYINDYEKE